MLQDERGSLMYTCTCIRHGKEDPSDSAMIRTLVFRGGFLKPERETALIPYRTWIDIE